MNQYINKSTPAFIAVSWVALLAGVVAYCVGLFNAQILLSEKGFYLILILYGLFSAVSLQKIVRDKLEGKSVTAIYSGLCWASVAICLVLLALGLWNAQLLLSEKGFYMMAFLLSLFGAVAVQKNIRDLEYLQTHIQSEPPHSHEFQQTEIKDIEHPDNKTKP